MEIYPTSEALSSPIPHTGTRSPVSPTRQPRPKAEDPTRAVPVRFRLSRSLVRAVFSHPSAASPRSSLPTRISAVRFVALRTQSGTVLDRLCPQPVRTLLPALRCMCLPQRMCLPYSSPSTPLLSRAIPPVHPLIQTARTLTLYTLHHHPSLLSPRFQVPPDAIHAFTLLVA